MNRLSKILIIPLLIVMIFAFGMDASAVIHSKWVAGDFIFYDATQDILTIKDDTDGLIVGETTAGVDFKVWSDTASTYLLWDADADDLLLVGTATKLNVAGTTEATASAGAIYTDGGICAKKKVYVGTNLVLVAGPLDVSTAATDIKVGSDTDSALEFVINSTAFIDIDTRNAITGVTNVMFTAIASEIASGSTIWKRTVGITPGTTTLTGTTTCDNMSGLALYIAQPTLTCSTTVTVTEASTVYIVAEPAGSSVTIAAAYALEIASGDFLTAGKIIIDDQTEATASTGSIQTDGGISITKQLFLQDDIDMSTSDTGVYEITLAASKADALSITYGTDMMEFDSNTPRITITPTITVTGDIICDSSTEGAASTGSIQTDGGLSVALKAYVSGGLFLVSNAAATFLDFELGTSWQSGELINVDFGDSTTLTGAAVGFDLDLGTNVAATSLQDVTGLDITLPTMTMTSDSSTVRGIIITATGAFTAATSGTCVWTGVDITIPAITQGAGTSVTATGVKIVGQAITTGGTVYGVALSGVYTTAVNIGGTVATGIAITACTTANIAISGANVIGINMTGTYSAHGIAIGTSAPIDLVAYDDRLLSIYGSSNATGGNVMPLYVSMATDGACKARAAEFVLTPTAQLGQWANAVKTYLNLTGASGGTGTVSSLCVELLLPDEQMTGNIAPLEIELVAPASGFVALEGVHTGAAYFILAVGSGTKITEIDDHGYFLSLQGLTGASGGLVSENEQTLKCNIGTTVKYMMFSTTEGGYTVVPASGVTVVDVDLTAVWVSGTVLNVDFSAATTLSGSAVGLNLDFSAVHVDSDQAITAIDLTFPDLTFDAVTKAIVGVEISGDTLTQLNSGTGTWTGIDITIPTMVETGGTINAYGIKIVGGTLTTDPNTYGIDLTGTFHHAIKIGASGAGISYSLDGDINVAIYSTFTGDVAFFRGMYVKSDYAPATAGEASVYGIRGHANLADGQTHDAGALTDESFVGVHGYATSHSGGTFDAAGLTIAGIKGEVGGTGTYTAAKVVCGVWAKPALSSSVSAGHYTGVYVYASHGSYPADSMLYAWGYYESGIDFSGWASATKPAFVFRAGAGIVTSPNHTALSTEDGSIQIKVGGDTRYIKVYDDS